MPCPHCLTPLHDGPCPSCTVLAQQAETRRLQIAAGSNGGMTDVPHPPIDPVVFEAAVRDMDLSPHMTQQMDAYLAEAKACIRATWASGTYDPEHHDPRGTKTDRVSRAESSVARSLYRRRGDFSAERG